MNVTPPARPAGPAVGTVFFLGFAVLWLALALVWTVMYARQEAGLRALDATLAQRGRTAPGQITQIVNTSSGDGPASYSVNYEFQTQDGRHYADWATLTPDDLDRLAPGHSSMLLPGTSVATTVLFDPADPERHRLADLPHDRAGNAWVGLVVGPVFVAIGIAVVVGCARSLRRAARGGPAPQAAPPRAPATAPIGMEADRIVLCRATPQPARWGGAVIGAVFIIAGAAMGGAAFLLSFGALFVVTYAHIALHRDRLVCDLTSRRYQWQTQTFFWRREERGSLDDLDYVNVGRRQRGEDGPYWGPQLVWQDRLRRPPYLLAIEGSADAALAQGEQLARALTVPFRGMDQVQRLRSSDTVSARRGRIGWAVAAALLALTWANAKLGLIVWEERWTDGRGTAFLRQSTGWHADLIGVAPSGERSTATTDNSPFGHSVQISGFLAGDPGGRSRRGPQPVTDGETSLAAWLAGPRYGYHGGLRLGGGTASSTAAGR